MELKSRFLELYPMHECASCGLEHVRIPHIRMMVTLEGQQVSTPFLPFEVVGVAEGSARPGRANPLMDTPVHVYVLSWGLPGAQQAANHRLLLMN